MTCDERIEALLNRAGQTISDLPRGNDNGMPYGVDTYKLLLKEASDFTQFIAPAGFEVFNVIQYAMHLTDIIDRLEWALDKTLREKAYLMANCCSLCGALDTLMPFNYTYVHPTCEECDIEHVPDDWREDDACLRSGTNWTIRRTRPIAERVVNRFMIIKGLKAYLSGDYDNADNPYWDAENETFNGGQLAIDAIRMLETDYKLINETMNLMEKATGVEIGENTIKACAA